MSDWLKMILRLHADGKMSEVRLSAWLAWYLKEHPVELGEMR